MKTIQELSLLKEHNDHVEFKRAKHNFPFAGGSKADIKERRKCVLGYTVALANEGGGRLVLGMEDHYPHEVAGTDFAQGELGNVEDEVYERLGIRISAEEHYDEKGLRVVVFTIPSRPIGKALRFEGVPLMRIGESLREMDDSEYYKIISEPDSDYSAKVCEGISLDDLDLEAVAEMRQLLADKRKKHDALSVPLAQLLSDFDLLSQGKLNYAALILLGKSDAIRKHLPQFNVVVEYRTDHSMTRYTARKEFCGPMLLTIKQVWDYLNQPASNPLQHVNNLPQIIDVPSFNQETIREALINAFIHRSLQMNGDILVRQYPDSITITNPGGFPYGVNLGNLLTVNSCPRSRRMAEVIERTGLIERSGQGVDIMFANCISEGKDLPDYSQTDDYQVCLTINAKVNHPVFSLFVNDYKQEAEPTNWLNVFDLLSLRYIMLRQTEKIVPASIERLFKFGLIKGHSYFKYVLGNNYYNYLSFVKNGFMTNERASTLFDALSVKGNCSMSDFIKAFESTLTLKQTRTFIQKCVDNGILGISGKGKSTTYQFGEELKKLLPNQL